MVEEDYSFYNLDGPFEYSEKIENGERIIEVDEFCCYKKEKYVLDRIYEWERGGVKIRNFLFYCQDHLL